MVIGGYWIIPHNQRVQSKPEMVEEPRATTENLETILLKQLLRRHGPARCFVMCTGDASTPSTIVIWRIEKVVRSPRPSKKFLKCITRFCCKRVRQPIEGCPRKIKVLAALKICLGLQTAFINVHKSDCDYAFVSGQDSFL